MATKSVFVPATTKAGSATVEVTEDGTVTLNGARIGVVYKGHYGWKQNAAGHHGRILRASGEGDEWRARVTEDGYEYKGSVFPSHYRKNTRKAALAFLVAAATGAASPEYFYWERS